MIDLSLAEPMRLWRVTYRMPRPAWLDWSLGGGPGRIPYRFLGRTSFWALSAAYPRYYAEWSHGVTGGLMKLPRGLYTTELPAGTRVADLRDESAGHVQPLKFERKALRLMDSLTNEGYLWVIYRDYLNPDVALRIECGVAECVEAAIYLGSEEPPVQLIAVHHDGQWKEP